jgi:hypothetical protein
MKQREVKSGMEVMYNGSVATVMFVFLNSLIIRVDHINKRVTYNEIEPNKK